MQITELPWPRGEGSNHKALRFWIAENPRQVRRAYANFETVTEVVLESADRVGVVYYGPTSTIVVEVKSLDSDDVDLKDQRERLRESEAVWRAEAQRKRLTWRGLFGGGKAE